MSGHYRFLPWVRRGLVSQVPQVDGLDDSGPDRAELSAGVSVNAQPTAPVNLRLYGPGDVVGIDPRGIVRLEPRRFAQNFEANHMAAIEFDEPDFPWMFTPARANSRNQLRPWLVLVVVRKQEGVAVRVNRDLPVPVLEIKSPAEPRLELPSLDDSWSWAHAQVITEDDTPEDVHENLETTPDLNVSRLICPRRLQPNREYLACLVPAFESGRLAGLGAAVPDGLGTRPAWKHGAQAPLSIELPTYFHWEFGTGPAGDFESLARRLTPRPVEDGVGKRPMYVGTAGSGMPQLSPTDNGAILQMEGALKAPGQASGKLGEVADPIRNSLRTFLDAPAVHVASGTPSGAPPVGPPRYGEWQARQHTIPDTTPRWFRDANLDPRYRAAAGLGTEVVRRLQEDLMQAAWLQVGEVVAANELIQRARLAREALLRMWTRNMVPLDPEDLLKVVAPMLGRIKLDDRTTLARLRSSLLPNAAADPHFRRQFSARAHHLRREHVRASALGPADGPASRILARIADGSVPASTVDQLPDGIADFKTLSLVRTNRGPRVSMGAAGGSGTISLKLAKALKKNLRGGLGKTSLTNIIQRPDLGTTGLVTRAHLAAVEPLVANRPTATTHRALIDLGAASRSAPAATGFTPVASRRAGVPRLRPATGVVSRSPVAVSRNSPPRVLGPVRDVRTVRRFREALSARLSAHAVREASLPPLRKPVPLSLAQTINGLVTQTDPRITLPARLGAHLKVNGRPLAVGGNGVVRRPGAVDPIFAAPQFRQPMYRGLADYAGEALLPGIETIEQDTITLVQTNPRFVEAYMVGVNHEMGRELLWREYPADRRATTCQMFWDRLDGQQDMPPIHAWKSNRGLGRNLLGDPEGQLVLLVRGQLLVRFPSVVVTAVKATPTFDLSEDPVDELQPMFRGQVDPDVVFFGFDLSPEQAKASPGWFFVIHQQETEPRFAMDIPERGASGLPSSWGELHWGHAGLAPGEYLNLSTSPLSGLVRDGTQFDKTGAHLATATLQQPVRIAMHASEALPEPGT